MVKMLAKTFTNEPINKAHIQAVCDFL
jgi:hypothetical protein